MKKLGVKSNKTDKVLAAEPEKIWVQVPYEAAPSTAWENQPCPLADVFSHVVAMRSVVETIWTSKQLIPDVHSLTEQNPCHPVLWPEKSSLSFLSSLCEVRKNWFWPALTQANDCFRHRRCPVDLAKTSSKGTSVRQKRSCPGCMQPSFTPAVQNCLSVLGEGLRDHWLHWWFSG